MPTIERSGVRLYFEEQGEGPPLLFHTGGGGDARMWIQAGYTDALPGYRQILMDHRGHGRSGCPTTPEAHRLEEYVTDVVAVLDAAGAREAAFVGYSGGAAVGFRFVAWHPERCSALVALGQVPEPEDDMRANAEFAALVRKSGTRGTIEAMSASETEPAPAWLVDHLCTTDTEMFALMLEGWSTAAEAWDLLPLIEAPTLLICGEHELDPAAVDRAAARMPRGRAVVLAGYGHLQAFWHSEVTAPAIREFLAGL